MSINKTLSTFNSVAYHCTFQPFCMFSNMQKMTGTKLLFFSHQSSHVNNVNTRDVTDLLEYCHTVATSPLSKCNQCWRNLLFFQLIQHTLAFDCKSFAEESCITVTRLENFKPRRKNYELINVDYLSKWLKICMYLFSVAISTWCKVEIAFNLWQSKISDKQSTPYS